jgi:hypothetical protein
MKVTFRKEKDGTILAVFGQLWAWYDTQLTAYAHIGQHTATTPEYYRTKTKPATPEESAPLLAELRALGYDDLQVVRRLPLRRIYAGFC